MVSHVDGITPATRTIGASAHSSRRPSSAAPSARLTRNVMEQRHAQHAMQSYKNRTSGLASSNRLMSRTGCASKPLPCSEPTAPFAMTKQRYLPG